MIDFQESNAIPVASGIYQMGDINTLQSDESCPYSINDNGQICGTFKLRGKSYVFIHDNEKDIMIVDIPDGCIPVKINNLGNIVGNYINQNGSTRGFFWNTEDGFIDLGSLGGLNTVVMDLNDHGQIVGYSETGRTSLIASRGKEKHAFLWESGSMQNLDVLKGDLGLPGDLSVAVAINNKSEIIRLFKFCLYTQGKSFYVQRASC